MEIIGYFLSLVIGVTLGLIGGGGSILTVPVLVYILAKDPILATAYSLFIVGASSSIGAIQKFRQGLVDVKTGVIFALPSLIAVYLTRMYVVPAIPDPISSVGGLLITKNMGIMLLFAIIMVLASVSMIRGRKEVIGQSASEKVSLNYPMVAVEGLVVGFLTGLVGAGGGFLIIPALVLLANLPMKTAVGTSLMIIGVKSLIGFIGDVNSGQPIVWSFLLGFTAFTVIGIFVGSYLSHYIPGHKLKKGFGWFVLVMAIYILLKELL